MQQDGTADYEGVWIKEMTEIRTYVIDMNDTYPDGFEGTIGYADKNDVIVRISMRDIPGINMYCSDDAFEEIRNRLSSEADREKGIHFIDTGNYHYMSRIITSFIEEEYDLILFDHHTDMQDTAFGGILSCGSWVREVLDKDEHIRSVLVIGPPEPAGGGYREDFDTVEKVFCGYRYYPSRISADEQVCMPDIPVYVSVDKDILNTSECRTNWDQGDLTIDELMNLISVSVGNHRIIGADICGGISKSDPEYGFGMSELNAVSDIRIYDHLKNMMQAVAN
jgi:hypothetical protein